MTREPDLDEGYELQLSRSAAIALKEVEQRIQNADSHNFKLKYQVELLREELKTVVREAGLYAAKCAAVEAEFEAYRNERSGLTDSNSRVLNLLRILKKLEWATNQEGLVICLSCKRLRLHGHSPDCQLARELNPPKMSE